MATKSKGRICHFAISVPDPWAAAEFYKNAFGLEELGETDSKLAEGVFLTDGVVNLALLKFKDDGGGIRGPARTMSDCTMSASGSTTRLQAASRRP
jgi:predicted enzyme related to lactoylglutathione lyase